MAYLVAIVASLVLFFGFLLLTRFETARGARFFEGARRNMDARVGKAAFVASHVDWSAFTSHLLKAAAARIAHDVAHASLIIVRVIERLLTRMVKYLRSRRPEAQATLERPEFSVREAVNKFRKKNVEASKDETV